MKIRIPRQRTRPRQRHRTKQVYRRVPHPAGENREYVVSPTAREKIAADNPLNSNRKGNEQDCNQQSKDNEMHSKAQLEVHSDTQSVAPQPNKDPLMPTQQKDPVTPAQQFKSGGRKNNLMNEMEGPNYQRIEGHSLSVEDHISRAHILYSLPNLNSLPRRLLSEVSYLNISQRKTRQSPENGTHSGEQTEIESRIRATEDRICPCTNPTAQ